MREIINKMRERQKGNRTKRDSFDLNEMRERREWMENIV